MAEVRWGGVGLVCRQKWGWSHSWGAETPGEEVGKAGLGSELLCEPEATVSASRGTGAGLEGWGMLGAHHLHAILLHAPAGLEVRADALAGPFLELRELPAARLDDGLDLLLGLLGDGHHAVQVLIHEETHEHLRRTRAVGRAGLLRPRPGHPRRALTLKALRRSGSMPSESFILSLSSWSSWSSSSSSAVGARPTVRSSGQPLTSVLMES